VTPENFGQPGVNDYRNPHLAEAMRCLGYAQHFGVGIQIARDALARNGNPPLEFRVDPRTVFPRSAALQEQCNDRARLMKHLDDWEEEDDESSWGEDGDDDYTMPCPYCKRPIHEDAPRCPYCEHYLSEEDAPRPHKPWWIVAGAVICLYVVYRWIAG
jgi:hypothetical protein